MATIRLIVGVMNVENDPNYEAAIRATRRLCTAMARSSTDATEVRIAKEAFRWSIAVAGAAVLAVVLRSNYSELGEVGRTG
jgi:anti-sigma-K factor RskA